MNKLYRLAETKGIDPKGRMITAWASRADVVDRDGELITAEAWQHPDSTAAFERNPVLMPFHNYQALPLGKVTSLDKNDLGLAFAAKFAKTAAAEEAFGFIQDTGLASFSVGFLPKSSREVSVMELLEKGIDVSGARGDKVRVFDHVELVEISLAPIPSNPRATALGAAFVEGRVKSAELQQILEPWGREVSEADIDRALAKYDLKKMADEAIRAKLPEALHEAVNERYRAAIKAAILEAEQERRQKERAEAARRLRMARLANADLDDPAQLEEAIAARLEAIDFKKLVDDQIGLAIDRHRGRVR